MLFFYIESFFFKFHPLSICWLRIELHNLFWFILYGLSQPHKLNRKFDKLIQADSDCFFWYVFYEVFSIHDSGHEFDRLTRVDSGHFFSIFFLIDFFSISSSNSGLIGNYASWFVSICVITMVSWPGLTQSIQYVFVLISVKKDIVFNIF